MKHEMQIDWQGIISLLANHLYSDKRIFIREIIQNANDAIMKRRAVDSSYAGRIHIVIERELGIIRFEDDGLGMDESDLIDFLSCVARGQSSQARIELPGVVGQFGIGFLSAFVVADSVEVQTRKVNSSKAWKWINNGSRDYDIEEISKETIGTIVLVHVSANQRGLLETSEVKALIKHYCDLLKVPIYLDAEVPINTMAVPWERTYESDIVRDANFRLFLEERVPDNVLEVIPIAETDPVHIEGLLYISKSRWLGRELPRHMQIYCRRMMVGENVDGLLPAWANFVNGIINSNDLTPTAARDNIARNNAFEAATRVFSEVILRHLTILRTTDRERFSEILRYHRIRIRQSCLLEEEFFERFANDLDWKVNRPRPPNEPYADAEQYMSLQEILQNERAATGKSRAELLCFESGNSDHFFEMANAAGRLVIDVTDIYEADLLRKCVRKFHGNCKLAFVDREDHEALFAPIQSSSSELENLGRAMEALLQPGGAALRVSVRSFQPPGIPGLLRRTDDDEDRQWAQQIIDDPNASPQSKRIARQLLQQPPKVLQFTLNAENPIVRKMSKLSFITDSAKKMLLGLYNATFLVGGTMTPSNARILSRDFLSLLESNVDWNEASDKYQREIVQLRVEGGINVEIRDKSQKHRVFFMVVPFAEKYDKLESVLREIVEERWNCQLVLARDQKLDDRILDSVRQHMAQADAFVADLTEANPNVMFEFGAIFAARRRRPVITLLNSRMMPNSDDVLPADIQSTIYVDYGEVESDNLTSYLETEMRKAEDVCLLLDDSLRHQFLSPKKLISILGGLLTPVEAVALNAKFPTKESWLAVKNSDEIVKSLPNSKKALHGPIFQLVKNALLG